MPTSSTPAAFGNTDLTLAVGAGIYHDIQHFLFREALLLDHRRFDEWATLLADDVVFRMPARFAREIGIAPAPGLDHFHDDRRAITARIKSLQQKMASEGGKRLLETQTRRLITNVLVCPCKRDEYNVLSYMLLTRSTPDEPHSVVFSAERYDQLRGGPRTLRIVRREIVMDPRNADVDIDMYL